jgi:phosphoglucomutase/phosphomannomutase
MLPGASGMDRMKEIMATLRAKPPATCGGLDVVRTRDQATLTTWTPGGKPEPYEGVKSDLVIFDLAGLPDAGSRPDGRFPALGNAVAARPSGTEPKIKFYLYQRPRPGHAGIDLPEELESAKAIAQKSFDSLKAAVVADMRARLG